MLEVMSAAVSELRAGGGFDGAPGGGGVDVVVGGALGTALVDAGDVGAAVDGAGVLEVTVGSVAAASGAGPPLQALT